MAFSLKPPKSTVHSNWKGQIVQQERRVTGVTPKGLRSFQEAPAKFIPRATGMLKRLATGKVSPKKGLGK